LLFIDRRRGLLHPLKFIDLRGDFSFDAISPRGSRVYLIQYVNPNDPTSYLVRAYDVGALHLLQKAVAGERSDKMRGNPLTRATSPDGRWAYTLYDGAGGTPFVHALDTGTGSARCIDLPALKGANMWQLRFRLDRAARTLSLADGPRAVLAIDTRTFVTRMPAAPAAPPTPAAPGTGIPWTLVAPSILGALAAAAAAAIFLRRRGASLTRPGRSPVRAS
jgi:hypothetical protein